MRINQLTTSALVLLAVAEALLVLLSWLLSASMTTGVRSLLSSEGIRWFFGQYTTMLQSPVLVWLLVLSVASGVVSDSRVLAYRSLPRERTAMRMAVVFLLLYVAVVAVMTLVPHALLLSATGSLFPSPFSRSLIPVVAFGLTLVSAIYGIVAQSFASITQLCHAMSKGIAAWSPAFLVYLFFMQFYESLIYVFS